MARAQASHCSSLSHIVSRVTLSAGAAVLTAASIIKMWRSRADCGVNNVSHNTATLD